MNPTPAPPMAGPVREPGAPAPGMPPMTRAADIAPRPAPEPIMPKPTGERAAPLPIKAPAKPGPAARMGARGTGGDFLASPRIAPPAPAAPRMAGPVSRETPITPKPTTDIAPGEAPQIGPPPAASGSPLPEFSDPKTISMRELRAEAANSGRGLEDVKSQYRNEGWRIENDPFFKTQRQYRGRIPTPHAEPDSKSK